MDSAYNLVTNIRICIPSATEFVYGNLNLVYYSHLPAMIIGLLLALFVYRNSKELPAKALVALSLMYSLWIVANLASWISSSSLIIMFAWSILAIFDVSFYALTLYFVYVFLRGEEAPAYVKIVTSLLLLPIIVLTPTTFNLNGFDTRYCTALDNSFGGYLFIPKLIIVSWLIIFLVYKFWIVARRERRRILLLGFGSVAFLFSLFATGYIADTFERFDIEIYGLFGMAVFMAFLAYLIVQFKAFNIKLAAAQVLVIGLIIIIASELFFIRNPINIALVLISLLLALIFGWALVQSIKREIKSREHIEKLAGELAVSRDEILVANDKLKVLDRQKTEFVSIASHQLRAPLTAIKGYSSMLLEGSFGALTDKTKEAVERIQESSERLVNTIEDFLNITRIELGKMKYELVDFDLKKLLDEVTEELNSSIEAKGLVLKKEVASGHYLYHGDSGKIRQVLINLIDNAVKYTSAGSIKVSLTKVDTAYRVTVADTGVGLTPEAKQHLFEKFTRAGDGTGTNITGTGLGLYVAKQIVEAHGGKIWADSTGPNRGSTFGVELPLKTN